MTLLSYTETGQGIPVVLLHSGGMSGLEWQPQIQSLSHYFRVIVPDQLGHGASLMVAEYLTISDISIAILNLLDKLDIQQAILVGSSLGGAVALWITIHYPKRVKSIILCRTSYYVSDSMYQSLTKFSEAQYWHSLGIHKLLSMIHYPQGGPEAWLVVMKRVREALNPQNTEHMHKLEHLQRIYQPTLIIVGDRDPLAPLNGILDMYKIIPNCGLFVLPYTQHAMATNTWRAQSFTKEIIRFLRMIL